MLHAQLLYLGLAFVLNLCTKNVCSDIKKKTNPVYIQLVHKRYTWKRQSYVLCVLSISYFISKAMIFI